MKCKSAILLLLILFIKQSIVQAQAKHTISGYVKSSTTGEAIIGANIQIEGIKNVKAVSNAYGFFSLTVKRANYRLLVSALGYKMYKRNIILNKDFQYIVQLNPQTSDLAEVVISGKTNNQEPGATAIMGSQNLSMKEIENIPVIFGERDLVKVIQLMPGVKSAGEGSSGFFVRGGAADQNLVMLDEAVLYNPSHLMGFFSTFNSDAIKNVTLYKGSIPAQYGGRLSSMMDVRMNDGNNQKFSFHGGLGIIASRLTVEGPIIKNRGSFLISARRTYADLFLKLSKDTMVNRSALYFYDINFKANYELGNRDRIYASGYLGQDKLKLGNLFGIDWGNTAGTLRWNHQFNHRLFSNTSLIYSDYQYNIDLNSTATATGHISSTIKDWNVKEELSFYQSTTSTWRFGVNSIYHTIKPGEYTGQITTNNKPLTYSWENGLYVNNEIKVSEHLRFNYGLRLSTFSALGGPAPFYTLNNAGRIIDTMTYDKGKIVKTYFNLEPRLSAAYQLNPFSSLKASYSRNTQSLHQLYSSSINTPTDKWVATNNIIKPEISDQASLGYVRNLSSNTYEFSTEAYYKRMENQVDYRDGANVRSNDAIEPQLLFGKGRAYGIEFLLRKRAGRLTGWLGYTLSRTQKQIEGINNGAWYNARQDRTHDVSMVGIYDLSKKWVFSATFVYYTGNAVSFPSGKYIIDNQVIFLYAKRNAYRMPAYHRLDLSATYRLVKHKNFSSELALGLYNAYGRENPYTITFRQSAKDPASTEAVQTSLFKYIPSVSYNFKF